MIRSVRCVVRKAKDSPSQLHDVVGGNFQPACFLADLDVLFNKYMRDAGLKLTPLRDRVYLIRQLVRLLRQRLQPMLCLVFRAFSSGYVIIGTVGL